MRIKSLLTYLVYGLVIFVGCTTISVRNQLHLSLQTIDDTFGKVDEAIQAQLSQFHLLGSINRRQPVLSEADLNRLLDAKTRYTDAQSIIDKLQAASHLESTLQGAVSQYDDQLRSKTESDWVQFRGVVDLEDRALADHQIDLNAHIQYYNRILHSSTGKLLGKAFGYSVLPEFQY